MKITMVAPCLLGTEGMVSQELKRMGATDVSPENGRVVFSGGEDILARANINSRYSERILILMGSFYARTFEELFQGVKDLPWENWVGKTDAFPVKGSSLSSKLSSVPDCQAIIKKAVVERLKTKYKIPWFEETGETYQIQFLILKDRVQVMIDTTGAGLHKRGYRALSTDAPIKETLAAVMVDLSRVRSEHTVVDPFCGSGTILIEAAMKAMNIAPGINRTFAAQAWSKISPKIWQAEVEKAKSEVIGACGFEAYGFDVDDEAIFLAERNAQKAGVAEKIKFKKQNIRDYADSYERISIICNPPYGERLLDIEQAQELYRVMGQKFQKKQGHSYTVISPDDDFEHFFGRRADKRRKLYNGMIKCQVYMYFKNE